MFNISDYFKKFAKIEGDSLLERDVVRVVLFELCGLDNIKFDIKKGILYIQGSPMMKSLVYTKKGAILTILKTKLPHKIISDIR